MTWEAQLGDLNAAAQDRTEEQLHGPRTTIFDVAPGDSAWLPLGQYLLQEYADGPTTLAWRPKIGTGSWGPPLPGRRV